MDGLVRTLNMSGDIALVVLVGGGLALLWTQDIEVKLESYDKLHIDVSIH